MLSGRSQTTLTAPAAPPVNLEPHLDWRAALLHLGGAAICALLGFGAAQLARAALDTPFGEPDGARWLTALFAGAFAFGGAFAAYRLLRSFLSEIESVRLRRQDWHNAALDTWYANAGQVVEETQTEWALRSDDPRHVLLFAMVCYWQATRRRQAAPWSIQQARRFELHDDRGATLIGETSEDQARLFGDLLARAGIIVGRGERKAGQLAVATADELLDRIVPLLRRI